MRIALHSPITCINDLERFVGVGSWTLLDIYQKGCSLLKAANINRHGKILNENDLLHCALREGSCHWGFCKLLAKLHPEQALQKDKDGNLPIHIIATSKDSCDEETFLCMDCFMDKSELVSIMHRNGDTKYCCDDCFECEERESIIKAFSVKSGK